MRSMVAMMCLTLFGVQASFGDAGTPTPAVRFSFAANAPAPVKSVTTETPYSDAAGFGFELRQGQAIEIKNGCASSDKPFLFSVRTGEGNFRVTVTLGNSAGESDTTIKAEARRLMVNGVKTKLGESVQRTFTVNVRQPKFGDGQGVHMLDREVKGEAVAWDDKLTLEFDGPHPCVQAIDIEPAPKAITVFIAGDSTVCDQGDEPWTGWGQILPGFFTPKVAVANYAESGRALYSFRSELRLDKILSVIKPGDYLFIQFGHNDQKDKRTGAGAFTTYKADLESYVAAARKHGATPLLVTPMYRRRFDASGTLQESLGDFPAAVRQVAKEQNVALIDLHEMSGKLFQSLGTQGTLKAFVHYPADTFPGQTAELKDDTHFNSYGGYELARCVVEAIRTSDLPLAKELLADVKPFDPAKPDAAADVIIAPSPLKHTAKPQGN